MPTAMLSGMNPAHLPARAITLIVEREGVGEAIQLEVQPAVQALRPRTGMLVIPHVIADNPLTISVRPAAGGVFASPTVVHLTAITTDANSTDQERVVLPAVDVSELPIADLLVMTRVGNEIALRRAEPPDALLLSQLGAAALLAGRSFLGASRLRDRALIRLNVIVDASASMQRALDDGSLKAAIDVLVGLAPIVATDRRIHPLVAGTVTHAVDAEPSRMANAVTDLVASSALTTGFLAAGSTGRSAVGTAVTYVVTDSVPADHEAIAERPDKYHLVLLAAADCTAVVASMCELSFTVIDRRSVDRPASAQLLDDRFEMDRIVRGLLSAVPALAGSVATSAR